MSNETNLSSYWLPKYLPPIMQEEERALNLKNMIASYGAIMSLTDENYNAYGNIQDLQNNTGYNLDATGRLFGVSRNYGENDTSYRNRIITSIANKMFDCSLVSQNELLKQYYPNSGMYVDENPFGQQATISIEGWNDYSEMISAMSLIENVRAAGIKFIQHTYEGKSYASETNQFGYITSINKRDFPIEVGLWAEVKTNTWTDVDDFIWDKWR